MKNIIFVNLFLSLMLPLHSFSQWQLIQEFKGTTFNDVQFLNNDTGFFAGQNGSGLGVIYHTQDGGITWDSLILETYHLNSIHFPCPDTGYTCGYSHTIYKTVNGGDLWFRIDTPTFVLSYDFKSIIFIDGNHGYITQDGYLFHTFDGGLQWSADTFNSGGRRMAYRDSVLGCVSAGAYIGIIRDQGSSFTLYKAASDASLLSLDIIGKDQYITGGIGWDGTMNYGVTSLSVDGGINWQMNTFYGIKGVTDITFVNDTIGYFCAYPYYYEQHIWKTIDGGSSWHPQSVDVPPQYNITPLLCISCPSDTVCYASGYFGTIYKTVNGGGPLLSIISNNNSSNDINVQLSPNPARDFVTIRITEPAAEEIQVFVSDCTGRIVLRSVIPKGETTCELGLGRIRAGVYFVRVSGSLSQRVMKLVKE
ncbi:MAG: T9SS type A sorting domain-containing protein [Bacteroidetes bacterium]|nr:T9SS type A sorting domain-containing protein [Bacteroidota bacterium]MBU1719662.1 T9SS type A sorting domain-containing protein [Bacteroidota bacterium]